MKVNEYIKAGQVRLEAAALECADPKLHMKQIVAFVMGWSFSEIFLHWDEPLSETDQQKIEAFLRRRLQGEPFQYIAGEEWFWKSRFVVGPGVLIPRKETELLVEILLERLPNTTQKVAELGPGSGNIGLSVCLERPQWEWHAFELNPKSLPYLKENHKALLRSSSQYQIHDGDFFTEAQKFSPYDVLVSNPPYVASCDLPTLSREVRSEPQLALDGGVLGMEVLSRFFAASVSVLSPKGVLLTEIGSDQGELAAKEAARFPFAAVEVLRDYAGLPRAIWAVMS